MSRGPSWAVGPREGLPEDPEGAGKIMGGVTYGGRTQFLSMGISAQCHLNVLVIWQLAFPRASDQALSFDTEKRIPTRGILLVHFPLILAHGRTRSF